MSFDSASNILVVFFFCFLEIFNFVMMYNTHMIAMIATVYMYILYDLDTEIFQVNLLIDLIRKVP